jgi:hypothetical protein
LCQAAIAGLHLNAEKIVDFGVLCSLRQLLEEGFFHSGEAARKLPEEK